MPDRPTSCLYVVRDQSGDYTLAGQLGNLDVNTPDPLAPRTALRYARVLASLLPTDAVIHVSNVAANDRVVAALRGDR